MRDKAHDSMGTETSCCSARTRSSSAEPNDLRAETAAIREAHLHSCPRFQGSALRCGRSADDSAAAPAEAPNKERGHSREGSAARMASSVAAELSAQEQQVDQLRSAAQNLSQQVCRPPGPLPPPAQRSELCVHNACAAGSFAHTAALCRRKHRARVRDGEAKDQRSRLGNAPDSRSDLVVALCN